MTFPDLLPAVLLVPLFVALPVFAARAESPRLELPSYSVAQPSSPGGAATVDDARLRAELAAAAGRAAQAAFVPDLRRRFTVIRTDKPPAIDGKLDDPVWKKAVVLRDFTLSQSFNDKGLPSPAADPTETMVLYDDKGLYVGVRAFQDPKTIYATIKTNGWLRPDLDWEQWSEEWANTGCDEIEIAIDPELTMAGYYVFHVNPGGVRQTHYMPPVPTGAGSSKRVDPVLITDDRWKAAATRDDKGWCATLFIPFESIGFRPITASAPGDVFFDMVQERTVMGFNVNRISHQRHEPSSWSPSKGAMFFRDVENFGNAYFAALPATLEDVKLAGADGPGVSFVVRSQSDKAQDLSIGLALTADGATSGKTQPLSLAPGESKSLSMDFTPAPSGRQSVEIRVLAADGSVVDRARYAFEVPPPVDITVPRTVLYEGETDFPAIVRFNLPAGAAGEMQYSVTSGGRVVTSLKSSPPASGQSVLPFELDSLAVGDYEFTVQALAAGKPVASVSRPFKVIAAPWKIKVVGKAGDGPGPQGVPSGFTVLASTMPGGQEPSAADGSVPYADETMKTNGSLIYAQTSTADFASGGSRRRRRASAPAPAFPRKAQLAAPLYAFAAGGEYESISFAVFALEDVKAPRVEFTELASASGAVIPASQMDLRAERGDGYVVKEDSLGDIPKNTGRRYFLTVYVAPGTPAGAYSGTITFSSTGRPAQQRPYGLLVLPFALPDSPSVNGIYGGLHGSADPQRDMVVAADLLAHGMDAPTCIGVLKDPPMANIHHLIWDLEMPTKEYWLGDGPERFNAELDEQVFKTLKDSGLRGPFVIEINYILRYLPCTEENAAGFESALKRIEALRAKYGLNEFVYHVVDEPNNHYTYDDGRYGRRYGIERVKFFGKVLHKLGLRSYVTMNSAGRGYDIGESVYDELDIWCANSISDQKQVDRWTTGGREVWLYNYAGDGWCKGAMRSTYGFYSLRVRATGVTIWYHPSYVGWNETERKVVARSAWDAAREGIDDCRYAALLVTAIDTAQSAGGRKAELAAQARHDLDAIIGAYPVATYDKVAFEVLHDASDWDKWRWVIADWILKLQ